MRKNLLYVFLFLLPIIGQSQIATGDKLGGNIVGKDIEGNDINVKSWLDDGKTVIIDVFATWCGPCWSFHRAGVLEELYEAYGPTGTDQIRVLGIEGDASTTAGDLVGTGSNTLGDWTEGVKYPIMDDASHNTLLKIAFFPTLYVIRPDGTVFEGGDFRYNSTFWELAAVNYDKNTLGVFNQVATRTFCNKTNVEQIVKFYNMGTEEITQAKFDFMVNGDIIDEIVVNKVVPVFGSNNIITPKYTAEATSNFELKVKEINGTPVSGDVTSAFKVHKTEIVKNKIKIVFTTDYYPGETSWELLDNVDNSIISATYRPGNDDQFGGGGPDANKAFEYDVELEDLTIECLTFMITDGYGDGMTAIPAGAIAPGLEIYDASGNLIKEKFPSDYAFSNSTSIRSDVDLLTSSQDVDIVSSFEVGPNPAADVLYVNANLIVTSKATTQIVNALGQTVMTMNNVPSQINVADLAAGNYSIVIRTKEGVATKRFMKM